ncbi:hypothetical protein Bpfe_028149, partial [Biomphalaria pfeifferi]
NGIIVNVNGGNFTYCSGKNEPIQLPNPFPELSGSYEKMIDDQNFIEYSWSLQKPGQKADKFFSVIRTVHKSKIPNIVSYDTWGIQINDVGPDDSAMYTALWLSTIREKSKNVTITVANKPILKSPKLFIKEEMATDRSKAYKCGEIEFLGKPPISIVLKASNGTILPSTFIDGFQILTVPAQQNYDNVLCEIDRNSEGFHCVPQADLEKWEGTDLKTGSLIREGGIDWIYIVIGCVGFLFLTVAIVVTVVLCRKMHPENKYSAKEEEAKLEVGSAVDIPPSRKADGSSSGKKSPIYKGSGTNVSASNRNSYPRFQPAQQEDYEEYEMNGKSGSGIDHPPPVAPKYRKKSEPILDAKGNEVRPPEKKPRSIFLTPSMEELDKINEAVRGGKGSQPSGTMV